MARQGGQVQLEESDMRLAVNIAKMANEGLSRAAIEETRFLIKKPHAEVREGKKWGVEFLGHDMMKAVIERHPAMLYQNHMAGCLPCLNGTATNLQTHWRRKGTGAPPPDRHREPTPSLPKMSPVPTGENSGAQHSLIVNLLAGYAYSHTYLPCAEFSTLDASAQDSQHDTDFDPDMLTDERTSTG